MIKQVFQIRFGGTSERPHSIESSLIDLFSFASKKLSSKTISRWCNRATFAALKCLCVIDILEMSRKERANCHLVAKYDHKTYGCLFTLRI